ncbi:MAG: choice-of-anchor L domain-containing protein, partial [Kiritimatiellae bacterium]|nr:choice-of-anchor L domain-containing protein [Kiritimatiellia bacterium]
MGPGTSVDITSVAEAPGASAIGTFSQLRSTQASFSNGVMLTTGAGLWGCNYSPTNNEHGWSLFNRGQNNSFVGDADLEADFGLSSTYDAASIDLVVVPDFSTLNIRYFVASEEYFFDQSNTNDYDVSWYDNTDVFAFYVGATNEPSQLTNIALTPEGVPISVRSVNIFTNAHLFTPNLIIDTNEVSKGDIITPCAPNDIPYGMQYNGIIAPLVATVRVVPGQPYRLKIVIADGPAEPSFVDTAVFLEQFSLTSGTDLRVTVDPVPASVSVGGGARYDVTVSNIGPVPAADVVVTNWLPAGIGATNTVAPDGATVQWFDGDTWMTCALGTLTNGHSRTLTFYCPFDSAGAFTNAAVVGTSTGDYNPTNNADEGVVYVGASIADLSLSKSGPATAYAGAAVTYELIVTNAGPGDAMGLALADLLPDCMTPVGPTNWTSAALAAGASAAWSLQATIAPDAPSGWVTNQAAVSAASSDPDLSDNVAEAVTWLAVMSDLSLLKTGPADGVAGEALSYTLIVSNAGPSLARAVELTDTPPTGTTAQSPLTYALGDLTVGASTSLLVTVDVHADTLGWITNRAEVSCGSDSNLVNDFSEAATLIAAVADVSVIKSGPATGVAGETLSYTLTVTNAGPSLARNVTLDDTPPTGTTAQSPLTYTLGDLAVGVSTSLQFTVDVHAGTQGWITNRATVVCASDTNLVNNASEAMTLIASVADVSVSKNGPATGVAGEALTYTLTVANAGPSVACAVELSDTPPTGTTAQSPLTYTLGDLAVGVSTSLQFTVDVHADTQGWITNRATVVCASDTNLVNNASEAMTLIASVADVSVVKTGPATGVAGETLSYTLT